MSVVRTHWRRKGKLTKTVGWREITAKRGGVCGICGKRFKPGARVFWIARGSNCRHPDCHQRASS